MNQPILKAWIEALRSNNYKQTHKKMFDGQGFCFLGLLCNLYDNSRWVHIEDDYYAYGTEASIATPPSYVLEWLGVNPKEIDYFLNTMMEISDLENYNFEAGADFLESLYVAPTTPCKAPDGQEAV